MVKRLFMGVGSQKACMISRVLLQKLDPNKLVWSIEFCYRSVDHKKLV